MQESPELIDAQDSLGNTPCHYAALKEHVEVVEVFIQAGMNLDIKNKRGLLAKDYTSSIEVSDLINNVSNISHMIIEEESTIEYSFDQMVSAAANGEIDSLKKALSKFPQLLNHQCSLGWTLLHTAVSHNQISTVKFLLDYGAWINFPNELGCTPLMSCDEDQVDIKELLINNGALQIGSMHQAVLDEDIETIKSMHNAFPQLIHSIDANGQTPLHYAVCIGHKKIIQELINLGAKINVKDSDNQTPFNLTSVKAIQDLLLKNGAVYNDPSRNVLHEKVSENNLSEVKRILDDEEKLQSLGGIDCVDNEGVTPLLLAAQFGHEEVFDLLLERGANLQVTCNNQENVIDYIKTDTEHSKEFLKGVKELIGFSDDEILRFEEQIKVLLDFHDQQRGSKNLLLILGETHGVYRCKIIEKLILNIAQARYRLNNVYVEAADEEHMKSFKVIPKVQGMGFECYPVDIHPERDATSVGKRNVVMAREVNQSQKPGVMLVGSDHLKGLLTKDYQKIDTNIYHVVALNLSPLWPEYTTCHDLNSQFAKDSKLVTQVTPKGIKLPPEIAQPSLKRKRGEEKKSSVPSKRSRKDDVSDTELLHSMRPPMPREESQAEDIMSINQPSPITWGYGNFQSVTRSFLGAVLPQTLQERIFGPSISELSF